MKKTNRIWIAHAVVVLLLGFTLVTSSRAEKVKIAVFKSRDIEPYNKAITGFKKALTEKGISAELTFYDMRGYEEEGSNVCEDIRKQNPALILTLGSEATDAALKSIDRIPILFTVVLDPLSSGFVKTLEKPGGNLTGISMEILPSIQFKSLKYIMPGARRIGFIFDADKLAMIARKAEDAAKGLDLQMVPFPIYSQQELPEVLKSIPPEVDALWMAVDRIVYTRESLKYILLFALRNKLPVIGYSRNVVRAGALFGLVCDYEDLGKQAGESAFRILSGELPGDIPVEPPRKELLIINQIVADRLKFDMPDEMIAHAHEIFK